MTTPSVWNLWTYKFYTLCYAHHYINLIPSIPFAFFHFFMYLLICISFYESWSTDSHFMNIILRLSFCAFNLYIFILCISIIKIAVKYQVWFQTTLHDICMHFLTPSNLNFTTLNFGLTFCQRSSSAFLPLLKDILCIT